MRYVTSIERLAIEEGMQQGRLEGKLQLLARFLAIRFGQLPEWVNDRLNHADENALNAWTEAMLSAASLEALFSTDHH